MFRSDIRMKIFPFIILLCTSAIGLSQIGGSYTYAFLDMPATARITAMGGNLISIGDDDPGQASDNPAMLRPDMDKTLVLSYTNYFAGINNGFVSYTKDHKLGTFNAGLKYLDYGKFREADAGNNEIGTFSASELALILGYGKPLDDRFSIGANLKFIYSNLYLFNSMGLAIDASGMYEIEEAMFQASLVFKNIGIQLKPYQSGQKESLPFDIQFGISKGFKKMPFKFSLVAHQLGRGRLTYPPFEQPTSTPFDDDAQTDNSQSTGENILRHFIIGTEFTPFKNFHLYFAYNLQRRKEMTVDARPGTVGLSWGLSLRLSKFHITYARSAYHLTGSPNHFTVLTRFSDWKKESSSN